MATIGRPASPISIEESLKILLTEQESAGGNPSLREKLIGLEQKLAAGQLYIAALGQMKRGKSSIINALLGADVLPTGVLPATAIITEIRYGATPEAVVVYATGGMKENVPLEALADYITEGGNPENKKQVGSIKIAYPSPFLENGVVLIDTPGIGSTHVHNTQTTESYLEKIDAGIVVFSVDPPITEAESQFLRQISKDIPKLFFILNKTDAATHDEVSKISRFLENELERLEIESPEIFTLSARQALQEKQGLGANGTTGLKAFELCLQKFLAEEKRKVLVRSVALDALQIARTLKFAASLGMRAGELDMAELADKRIALERLLDRTEDDLRELRMLLNQSSADILSRVEQDLKNRVKTCVPDLQRHLKVFESQHPKETGRTLGKLLENFLMQEVEAVFQKWRLHEDESVRGQLNELSLRFGGKANGILYSLEKSAGSLFGIPVEHLTVSCPLRVESHLRYRVEPVFYSLDSLLLFLPRFLLRPIVLRRIHNNVPVLLDLNSGRIRYDYIERLQASMNRLEKELCDGIRFVVDALKSAIHRPQASEHRRGNSVALLDSVIRQCSQLMED